jgi:glycosyltransferase involved in cell wall biosynthesis
MKSPAVSNHPDELTFLMPCLNEAGTVGICVEKARHFLADNNIRGEVVVADNNSTDGSGEVARNAGARVVRVRERGYGSAVRGGINASLGRYIIVGDADDSYDFLAIMPFLKKLREGNELVMGNRFAGGIGIGAMPAMHQYFGNPAITLIGNCLFGHICGDFYCGLRGFSKEHILNLNLKESGVTFAIEMLIKAKIAKYKIAEIPIILYKTPPSHISHINRWRDGRNTLKLLFKSKLNQIL